MSFRVGPSWPRRWPNSGTGAAQEEMCNTHGLTYGFTSVRTPVKNSVPVATGVLTLCNFIGLDVLQPVCDSLCEEFEQDECAPPPLTTCMIAVGRLGRSPAGLL